METWQVLEKAAALIEERGWVQGAVSTPTGEICAIGAIVRTQVAAPDLVAAKNAIEGCVGESIASWNDAPGRTQDEVVETMRRVAQQEWEATHHG